MTTSLTSDPFISICIPAYKRLDFLKRLMDSIAIQSFRDFEVIVTDDSPSPEVAGLCSTFENSFSIRYYKNPQPFGTPENWNEAMRKAKGKWIKIMHDDDWFAETDSLQNFYDQSQEHPGCSFFFSAFRNIKEETGAETVVRCNFVDLFVLEMTPLHLFNKVYIGNPSCTLIRRDLHLFYDKRFKWVVDFEYYIRCIRKTGKYHYIDKPLINVGFNDEQVTKSCFRVPEVELPENHELLEKLGYGILRNPVVYDYYWRLYRNLGIRSGDDVRRFYNTPLHPLLRQMINGQQKVSPSLLKNGFISKPFMLVNYLFSLFTSAAVTSSPA
jgi:glycosyltransferase involved in cell wall biosynthesis